MPLPCGEHIVPSRHVLQAKQDFDTLVRGMKKKKVA